MLKIGEFSRIAQVSTKTLRLYDERGLLKPAWIDRFTGYRYYNMEQLAQLNRILALKDLGFSLEQIQQMMGEDLSLNELRGMLRLKQLELQRRMDADQARMARIAARMRHLETAGSQPSYDVLVKGVPPSWVLGIRQEIAGYDQVGNLFDQLAGALRGAGLSRMVSGPWVGIYHDVEYQDHGLDVEVAAPISASRTADQPARIHKLPGLETAACVLHRGGYAQLPEAHNALLNWVETSGYQLAGPVRDVYLKRPTSTADDVEILTEVQFAVKPKPTLSAVTFSEEQKAMEPKIISKPAFTVVGLKYHGKNENDEIPQMWGKLNPRWQEISNQTDPRIAYGICGPEETDGAFPYLAGFSVKEAVDIPAGMESWDVPQGTYAVFPCSLQNIGETYEYAFKTWLPQSAYSYNRQPDFEVYAEEFDMKTGEGMYIYIPVKAK